MNKDYFRSLSIEAQVELVNNILKSGVGLENACNSIGFARASIRERFQKSGYIFNKDSQRYVKLQSEHKGNYQFPNTKVEIPTPKEMPGILFDEERLRDKEVIRGLQVKVDELYSLISKKPDKEDFKPDRFTGAPINRTYKIYSEVLEDFNEFCKQNKQYKVQDIISHALREFLDKYY